MTNQIKRLTKIGVLFLGITLLIWSCQKDDTSSGQDENTEIHQNNVISSYISGDEIPSIIDLLGHDSNTTSRTDTSKSSTISSPFGSISIENILEVIDTLGNKKYSFKLTPKMPKINSIFNLVIDASNEPINIALLEYRMSPNFAQDYHDGLKTFSEFTGSIITFPFSPDLASNSFSKISGNTCIQNIDEIVDCSIIIIDGGTAIVGGSGSTTLDDTTTYTYTGVNGGSSGASGNGTHVVWVCSPCGVSHINPSKCRCPGSGNGSGGAGAEGMWIAILYPNSYTDKSSNTKKSSTENCCDETVVVGEIGVNFFDLSIEIRTALDIPGRSIEGLWLTAYATDTQLAELNNYIENNKDSDGNLSPDAQEFGQLAVEAWANGGEVDFEEVDFDLEIIFEITETIEFQKQTCLKSIKDEVVETKQISNIIKKFEPTHPVLHLEWGMFENTNWGNTGQTSLNEEQNTAFININKESLSHASNIVMVKTIAHEIIHAELYRKLKELVDDYAIITLTEYIALQDNYLGIADYTFRYGELEYSQNIVGKLVTWGLTPNFSEAHHNQMADFYRGTLIEVMKAYDSSKNITRTNSTEFYEALSWAGLMTFSDDNVNTQYYDAWKKFKEKIDNDESNIPTANRTYNRYINIANQEYNSTGIKCN